MTRAALLFLLFSCGSAFAQMTLTFPASTTQLHSNTEDFTNYPLPVGPYSDGSIPTVVAEGQMTEATWRLNAPGTATLDVMDDLRQQLESTGFELLFECETQTCGGFDFRFSTAVLPEPLMHIDLGDFRFLSAQRLGEAIPEYVSLFVSRSNEFAFVQMIRVGAADTPPVVSEASPPASTVERPSLNTETLIDVLEQSGAVVLEDLEFETGSSNLGTGPFASLDTIAGYLNDAAERTIAFVGHTDAVGLLQPNIELSRRRAQSVVDRLISDHGVSENQIRANGVGYLAPRATNLTDEGRAKNRRVEAILTSTQ
ncbi:OmpA family protein [Litoreibacter roseus]|uniref:Membrane protein n=1 Tax=Litoreibacter roseus TaxID=2601869 RepID=A0A6N6JDT6_9RHOB|nr:OmpA family protein [Litoreibacter roseus]GFE64491.1 membrane protein [Litoreibacter roseus]